MVRLSVCLVFVFLGIFCALSEDFADRAAFLLGGQWWNLQLCQVMIPLYFLHQASCLL